jgi:sugar/nucleoside kinase (ribokinase family)
MTTEVTTVGEVIVDFVSTAPGTGLQKASGFVKAAGGAPANVAVGLARLGTRSAFIGKTGDDSFGRFLEATLRHEGVDTNGLRFDRNHKTRLAFVSLDASGGERVRILGAFSGRRTIDCKRCLAGCPLCFKGCSYQFFHATQ